MDADCFPSGPWTGFYTYRGGRAKWRQELALTFANGRIIGEGHDSVGPFVIAGRYDSRACECYWTKTYVGAHDVYYRGFREGKGIWGNWEIGQDSRGGFRIWPLAFGEEEGECETEEESQPVDAVGELVVTGPNPKVLSLQLAMTVIHGGHRPPLQRIGK
jgi:hypothetical protein